MDLNLWKRTKRERGLTYQDISARSGIPLGTIKNIFAGYTPDPRESTIKAIELALGVETQIVYKEKAIEQSPEEKELLSIFNALDPFYQGQILEYARYFAERRGIKKKNI